MTLLSRLNLGRPHGGEIGPTGHQFDATKWQLTPSQSLTLLHGLLGQ
jgi:hypothetical protein